MLVYVLSIWSTSPNHLPECVINSTLKSPGVNGSKVSNATFRMGIRSCLFCSIYVPLGSLRDFRVEKNLLQRLLTIDKSVLSFQHWFAFKLCCNGGEGSVQGLHAATIPMCFWKRQLRCIAASTGTWHPRTGDRDEAPRLKALLAQDEGSRTLELAPKKDGRLFRQVGVRAVPDTGPE